MYVYKKQIKDPELIKEAEKIKEIIQFMSETITNFEDFYKKTDNSEFNPLVSIEQALKIIDSTLKLEQIILNKNIDSKTKIYGNANSLAHVVLSIIQNVTDVIKVRDIQSPCIDISLRDEEDYILLSIQDNAGGIKATPIERYI